LPGPGRRPLLPRQQGPSAVWFRRVIRALPFRVLPAFFCDGRPGRPLSPVGITWVAARVWCSRWCAVRWIVVYACAWRPFCFRWCAVFCLRGRCRVFFCWAFPDWRS
ncbi:unnamed protein product, partial [Pylaiella littoralis]